MEQAERPAGDASSPAEGLQQEALGGLAVVLLRERAFRVHEALSRLARGGETWEGTQHALGAEAGYDERTARSALRDLESLGLVRSSRRGNRLIYQLLALTPEGVPFVVRRQSESRRGESGREVVRSARPSSLASEQIRGLVASLRAAPVASVAVAEGGDEDEPRRITADHGGSTDPDRSGSVPPVFTNPSMSSSSAASIRLPDPPPPSAWLHLPVGASEPSRIAGEPAPDEPLPAGWEPVVAALTSQTPDVDATPELVRLLLEHPLDWREAIERAAPHDPYAPDYLEACLWTAVRRREHRERLALAQEPASEPAPRAMPAVTVRPMANPRPLTLGEVVSGMRAMAQAGLMAALRRRRR